MGGSCHVDWSDETVGGDSLVLLSLEGAAAHVCTNTHIHTVTSLNRLILVKIWGNVFIVRFCSERFKRGHVVWTPWWQLSPNKHTYTCIHLHTHTHTHTHILRPDSPHSAFVLCVSVVSYISWWQIMTVPVIRPQYGGCAHTHTLMHVYTCAKCCHDNKGTASHAAQEGFCLLAMTQNQNQIVFLTDVYV